MHTKGQFVKYDGMSNDEKKFSQIKPCDLRKSYENNTVAEILYVKDFTE